MKYIKSISICLVFVFMASCNIKRQTDISYQYYSNGAIKSMSQIKNDSIKNGLLIHFYASGMIKDIKHFINNSENGVRTDFFDKSGKVQSICWVKNDTIQENGYDFYKSGYLSLITNKKNGIMNGRATHFYDSCDLIASITPWIVNGKFDRYIQFDRQGMAKYYHVNGKVSSSK